MEEKRLIDRILDPIKQDFKQKELIPVKVLFFINLSALLVLYPYFTIHMRELGISVEETAIMSALTPVVGILMPPLAGLLADKIGNFKIMLTIFSVSGGLSALLLLLIPIGRIHITYPRDVILEMTCTKNNPLLFGLSEDYPCDTHGSFEDFETKVSLKSCGLVCLAHTLNQFDADAVMRSSHYDLQMHNVKENRMKSIRFTQPPGYVYIKPKPDDQITNHMVLKNNELYSTTIRRLSNNSYYFPTANLFNFSCLLSHSDLQDPVYNETSAENTFELPTELYSCRYSTGGPKISKSFELNLKAINESDDDDRKLFATTSLSLAQGEHQAQCSEGYGQNKDYLSIRLELQDENSTEVYKNIELGSCATRCIATAPRSKFCKNMRRVIELDIQLTFWTYLCVRVFIGVISGTAYTMFEGAVIAILREYKADYGLQRIYAQIGGMISSPLSGLLIDYASRGKGYTNFRPIFYLYCGLKVGSGLLMLFINLEFKSPATSVVADVKAVMNIELTSLFVAAFLLGSSWGYIESFLFWLLEDLGGTKSLMGLTITVGGILGVPLLALSGYLVERFGHANIIFLGFLTYAVRLYGYSIIYNPWYALFFEAMECLTHSLCFTGVITYAAKLSTVTTDTTVQGIIGGLFYGVVSVLLYFGIALLGKSFGSLIGGYLIKYVGMRSTFQIFSAVSALTAFMYFAFFHLYMKKRSALSYGSNQNDIPGGINNKAKSEPNDLKREHPIEEGMKNMAFDDGELKDQKDREKQKNEVV